jgi:hypothetical protein
MKFNLKDLKIKIPYKWKVQTFSRNKPKATCVAYIDARDVMDLLDYVVGPENWKDEYQYVGNQWLCGLSIKTDDGMVTKWDTGVAGNFEAEKSAISDSFKRAGVKWGIGRFLYDMSMEYVDTNVKKTKDTFPYPVMPQDNTKRIWDLSEHINSKVIHKKGLEEARKQLRAIKAKYEPKH